MALPIRWIVLLVLMSAVPSRGDEVLAQKIDEIIQRPEYKQAHWGLLVIDAKSGKTIFEREPDRLCIPASTTKLYTCATALGILGPDHRFTTPIYQNGEVKNGVLHGDLILVASGDLSFGGRLTKDGKTAFANYDHTYANSGLMASSLTDTNPLHAIEDLAKQIAKAGVREIDGEILIDERLFEKARGTGSGPDLLGPMIVNDNVLDILVKPGKKEGELAEVRIRPESRYFQMDAEVKTAEKGKPTRLTLNATSATTFSVRGEIAVDEKPLIRVYFVDEPAIFARALLIEALRRQGVLCSASLFRPAQVDLPDASRYSTMPRIASYQSEPFAETMKVTLKVSHNLYASTLPLLVAAKNNERTLPQGLKRQGLFLKELGVPVETISFAGGAGGAGADSITPRATVALLQQMAKRPEANAYFDALPSIGVDGTLADVLPADSPVKGKVQAKTGTLVYFDLLNDRMLLRSKALAGRLETAKGTSLYFAMFVNNVPLATGVTPTREGKVLGAICDLIHRHGP